MGLLQDARDDPGRAGLLRAEGQRLQPDPVIHANSIVVASVCPGHDAYQLPRSQARCCLTQLAGPMTSDRTILRPRSADWLFGLPATTEQQIRQLSPWRSRDFSGSCCIMYGHTMRSIESAA